MSNGPGRLIQGSSLNSSCGRKLSLMLRANAGSVPTRPARSSASGTVRAATRRRRMSGGMLRVLLERAQDHGHGEVRGEQHDDEDGGGQAGVVLREADGEDYECYQPSASDHRPGDDRDGLA